MPQRGNLRYLISLVLFVLPFFMLQGQSLDTTGTQWSPYIEWHLINSTFTGNPFDLISRVQFTHEATGETHSTAMFYHGDSTWSFRFSATQTGIWNITTTSEDPDLDGKTGIVEISANPNKKVHGFLKNFNNKWGWQGTETAFVPQLIMANNLKTYHENPRLIDSDITEFIQEHGFNGFHIDVIGGYWFDILKSDEIVDPAASDPDLNSFETLEQIISAVHAAGGMTHVWVWGDSSREQTPNTLAGGINGIVDQRLQRYIAARLGPIPGWTMGYGYDLYEWVSGSQLRTWHDYLQEQFGWHHFLGARAAGPQTGIDHSPWDSWHLPLDYAGYEHHKPDYAVYEAALLANPTKPVFSEDRFRIRDEGNIKDYDEIETRRGLWLSTMAGGAANIWGNLLPSNNPPSKPYFNKNWIKTYDRFLHQYNRFLPEMTRDNTLSSGLVLRNGSSHFIVYGEDTDSVTVDLSTMNSTQKAIAVDTRKPYSEVDLGTLAAENQLLMLPENSDWAIAIGEYNVTGDVVAPILSEITVLATTPNSARIEWKTNESADSKVEYGTNESLGTTAPLLSAFVTSHAVELNGLLANTLYYFQIFSKDEAGNEVISPLQAFTTQQVLLGDYKNLANTATASASHETSKYSQVAASAIDGKLVSQGNYKNEWVENANTSVGVWLQLDFAEDVTIDRVVLYDRSYTSEWIQAFTLEFSDGSKVLYHGVNDALNNDGSAKAYNFTSRTVHSLKFIIDGVSATSNDVGLQEIEVWGQVGAAAQDVTEPVISNVQSSPGSDKAVISWETDEPADSEVEYGPTGLYGQTIPIDSNLTQFHTMTLGNLTPGETYHFRVKSRDQAGNLATSSDYSFLLHTVTNSLSFSDITLTAGAAGHNGQAEVGGHSAVWADIDGNNLPDLYVTYLFEDPVGDVLFYNNGDATFSDESIARGLDDFDGGSHGAVFADLDNDGDFDLFNGTTDGSPGISGWNNIFMNDGKGYFTDVTANSGIPDQDWETRAVVAFDWDNDGDLDLLGVNNYLGTDDPTGEKNEVFRNEGNMHFTPVLTGALVDAPMGQGCIATDFDNDSDVDILAANRTGPLNILKNDGRGTFKQITPESIGIQHQAKDGVTSADIDNDGDLDLLLASDDEGVIYRNNGDGTFSWVQSFTATDGYMGAFADFDNDGDNDLIFAGDDICYLNDGTGLFSPGPGIPVEGINDPRAIGVADIDNDGDLDFAIGVKKSRNYLIRNNSSGGNYVKIKLLSPQNQMGAFGAKVSIRANGELIAFREAGSTFGYLGQNDPLLTIGIGEHGSVDVDVQFLDGSSILKENVQANSQVFIDGVTADVIPPFISQVIIENITQNSATITWVTNEIATSRLKYGLDSLYTSTTQETSVYVTEHAVLLNELQPDTDYHFRAVSLDKAGNTAESTDFTFHTVSPPPPDTTAPVISTVQAISITENSAQIQWQTDEGADSQVEFGLTDSLGTFTTVELAQVTSHNMALVQLTAGTIYHFKVYSKDEAGNQAASAVYTFSTIIKPAGEYKNLTDMADANASHETSQYGQVAASAIDGLLVSQGTYKNEWVENAKGAAGVWLQLNFAEEVTVDKIVLYDRSYTSEWIEKFTLEFSDGSNLVYHDAGDALNNNGTATTYEFPSRTMTSLKFIIDGVSATSNDVGLQEIEVWGYVGGGTPDTTPPAISAVEAVSLTSNSAQIQWQTDEVSDSQVEYGLTNSLGTLTELQTSPVTNHEVQLADLSDSTVYYFKVYSKDSAGNTAVSAVLNFQTEALPPPDTTAPVISAVQAVSVTENSAHILWQTDEVSDSRVEFGLTDSLGTFTALQATQVSSHEVTLTQLAPSTNYRFKVYSKDETGNQAESAIYSFQTAQIVVNPGPIQFTDISLPAGAETPSGPEGYGHGVAGADYNNDGFIDIFVSNYDTSNALLINNQDGTFSDQAVNWSVTGEITWNDRGVCAADYNNDQNIDIYQNISGQSSVCFKNDGSAHFSNISSSIGIFDPGQAQAAAWADFNNDGLLDLVSVNYSDIIRFFEQNRDHTFTEQTVNYGLNNLKYGVGVVAFDIENDGDVDIFISRGETYGNLLLVNNGSNYFKDQASQRGIALPEMHGQGVTVADFDNDGDIDIYVCSDINSNKLFRNDGNGYFTDYTSSAGLVDNSRSTGCNFADFNNDGWPDLYVLNFSQPNKLYKNNGDGTFAIQTNTNTESSRNGYGSCLADFDRDGDIDIFISNSGTKSQLFDNISGPSNWLEIKLQGQTSNRDGIGAKVDFYFNNMHQRSTMLAGEGFVSGGILPLHFGLGTADFADSVIVNWPAGGQTRLQSPVAGQRIEVIEGLEPVYARNNDNDLQPPVISAVAAVSITAHSAQIQWQTDEPADSRVEYGASDTLGISTSLPASYATSHTVTLTELSDSTVYFYKVISKDEAGNDTASVVFTFTTLLADETPPALTNISVENITENTATIHWMSEEPATSIIEYGKTTAYDSVMTAMPFVTDHRMTLAGLSGDALYHYRIRGKDAAGNETITADSTFQTLADQVPPVISTIVVDEVSETSARINWETDEPATSQVLYGLSTAYGDSSVLVTKLTTTHSVILANLNADTPYHFIVLTSDAKGNAAKSTDQTFSTLPSGPVLLFAEAFDSTALDTQKWHKGTNAYNKSIVADGSLQLKSTNNQTAWVISRDKFVAKNTVVVAHIKQPNDDGDLAICPTYTADATAGIYGEMNWYRFYTYRSGGSNYLLYVQWHKNGVTDGLDVTGNLSISGEVYLRLRMDESQIYFDASTDGVKWTQAYSENFSLPGYTLNDAFHFALEAYRTDSKGDLLVNQFEIFDNSSGILQADQINSLARRGIMQERPALHVPEEFSVSANYPNPFNPQTRFDVQLPQDADITAHIFNTSGQNIAVIFSGPLQAGSTTLTWNGRQQNGLPAASGVYILRVNAAFSTGKNILTTRRMVLMK
ncbi:VCBS repeat-containing protein [candidate division KSB1 bacterium]|nr:VCBS repeat-containing protein [candidate division KSB1 bacterium]